MSLILCNDESCVFLAHCNTFFIRLKYSTYLRIVNNVIFMIEQKMQVFEEIVLSQFHIHTCNTGKNLDLNHFKCKESNHRH